MSLVAAVGDATLRSADADAASLLAAYAADTTPIYTEQRGHRHVVARHCFASAAA